MSFGRPLRGGCHCGRNIYVVQFPKDLDAANLVQVLFDSHPSHRSILATPLPAYLRVPLQYYRAQTLPYHDDETNSQIHRVYQPAGEEHAMRHFCGFCGTPLSYWSESPRSEADFIRLTLGSLLQEDLRDLEEWGLVPDPGSASGTGTPLEQEDEAAGNRGRSGEGKTRTDAATGAEGEREVGEEAGGSVWGRVGVLPWFETLTEGSRLGTTLRRARGGGTDPTERVKIEWEVAEWSSEDEKGDESPRKRKLDEVEDAVEAERTVGVRVQ
ncbi:uncharacterized protein P884DRAFT_215560 [Thermothelomyces heterothallicus CBS 202.75]|uniref:uncharacterized protein n=1 Tax=Thermothelomyces heterothallicus CBS 202.75 TaxID=1149848 RepID=UPI0037425E56